MISASYLNVIGDAIDGIAIQASLSQIGARFADAMAKFGFSALAIGALPSPEEDVYPQNLIESAPKGFHDFYVHEQFYAVDHLIVHARAAHEPFRFSDAPYTSGAARRHERFIQALETYEIGKGLIVPIGRPTNIPAAVWIGGKDPELHEEAIRAAQLISLFAASKAHALSRPYQPQDKARTNTPLTAREREVLQWTAAGKSAWEIGEILGIAKRTVDEHALRASRKLNAANRTHAVVVALRDRLISW